jgi:hypothetical protein
VKIFPDPLEQVVVMDLGEIFQTPAVEFFQNVQNFHFVLRENYRRTATKSKGQNQSSGAQKNILSKNKPAAPGA